jgi:hypothetical protein
MILATPDNAIDEASLMADQPSATSTWKWKVWKRIVWNRIVWKRKVKEAARGANATGANDVTVTDSAPTMPTDAEQSEVMLAEAMQMPVCDEEGGIPPRRIRALRACVTGGGHVRAEVGCQDAVEYGIRDGHTLISVLADGAGSAAHAEVGAQVAVAAALQILSDLAHLEALTTNIDTHLEAVSGLLRQAAAEAREAVRREAEARNTPLRAFASTLIVIINLPCGTAVAHIGDGAVVVRDAAGQLLTLSAPERGEYANETSFLTNENALDTLRLSLFPGVVTHMAAFTDGIQGMALESRTWQPHSGFFTPLFHFVDRLAEEDSVGTEQLTAWLQSPKIMERTDDDMSLLLARF